MMRQPEQPATVDGNYLVDTVAEQKAAVHDGHLRVCQWQELAIQKGCGHDRLLLKVQQAFIHNALPE